MELKIKMEILKSVRYYDDNDELYNEYNITFEYKGKKYIVCHMEASASGAWNNKTIGYLPEDFERLCGGGEENVDLADTTFEYQELIEAAELLEFSGKDELCYADYTGDGEDNEAKKLRQKMKSSEKDRDK